MSEGFRELGLSAESVTAIEALGYERPTPIQAQAIPILLGGQHLVAQSQTGTGKTAAFGLPLVDRVDPSKPTPQALVLCPTRELATQVAEAINNIARSRALRTTCVYGGQPIYRQIRSLQAGVHVVVATPGRLLDHLPRGTLDPALIGTVVLDEADEMLAMRFLEEVETVLSQLPKERQMALFSATMPPQIRRLAERHLRAPRTIAIDGTSRVSRYAGRIAESPGSRSSCPWPAPSCGTSSSIAGPRSRRHSRNDRLRGSPPRYTHCGMPRLNVDKAIAATATILLATSKRRMSHLKLLKILYRAERRSWQERAVPIFGDEAIAMEYGPLPEGVYQLIRGQPGNQPNALQILQKWSKHFTRPGKNSVGLSRSKPLVGCLSEYETQVLLDETRRGYGRSPFDMSAELHRLPEWVRNSPGKSSKRIPLRHILEAVRPGEDVEALLAEQEYYDQVDELIDGVEA